MKRVVKTRPYKGQVGIWEVDIAIYWKIGRAPYRDRKQSIEPLERVALTEGHDYARELEELIRDEIRQYGRPHTATERKKLQKAQASALVAASASKKVLTLSQIVARYLENVVLGGGHTDGTYDVRSRQINAYLLPLFGETPLDQIGAEAFGRLSASLRKTRHHKLRGAQQINEIRRLLYRILETAKEWGEITTLPEAPTRLKVPKSEIEIYTDAEYERLVVAAKEVGWQAYLLVLLCGDAGLRVGELLGLERSDLDLVAGYLLVRQQETTSRVMAAPKSKKPRRIKLRRRLLAALKAAPSVSQRVLVRDNGRAPTRYQVCVWLGMAERKAGIPASYSPHVLRHSFATRLANSGASPKAVQALLGHTQLETTLRYFHLGQGEADRAIVSQDTGEPLESKR